MSIIQGLPSEISRRIVFFLGAPYSWNDRRQETVAANKLAPYATISRAWQAEVEQDTYRRLHLTPDRVSHALAHEGLLSPARVSYIRSIHLNVVLDSYDDAARERAESDEEKSRNNETFTVAVREAFRLLGRLYESLRKSRSGEEYAGQLTLILTAHSPSDPKPGTDFISRRKERRNGRTKNLQELRYQSSYLELMPDPNLDGGPNLPDVSLPFTAFFVHGMPLRRFFSPAACCHLAARMHRLRQVNWQLWDNEKKDLGLRRRMRDEFAHAIPSLPSSIEDAELCLYYKILNELFIPRAVSDQHHDNLSAALGRWSRNLRQLYVRASSLSHDFFVAAAGRHAPPSDSPKLKSLTVDLSPALPSGSWLLTENPEHNAPIDSLLKIAPSEISDDPRVLAPEDRERRMFRKSPVEELVKPLILDIAGAVGCLPELKRLDVSLARRAFSVVYDVDARVLEIQAIPKFTPDDDAMEAWKNAARVQINKGHILTTKLVRRRIYGPPVEDATEVICEL